MSLARTALRALAVPLVALALVSPASAVARPLPPEDVVFIDQAVAAQMAEQGLPGVTVSVRAPGKGTFLRSYGTSNISTGRPLRPRDHYRIASVTKTFVATAILQLADRGRLSLDDRLSKYVAGVPNGDIITIRQLLGMRAGVFDWLDDPQFIAAYYADPVLPGWQPEDVIGVLQRNADKAQPPGQTPAVYSDSNYILLGLIIERVTHRSAERYIERKVVRPLGLRETSFPTVTTLPRPFSHGYDDTLRPLRDVTVQSVSVPWTAGAMVSTVPDMTRYARLLARGALLSPETQAERLAFSPVATGGPPLPFFLGYGFGMIKLGDWIGHDGLIMGYGTFVFYLPSARATIVVMVNRADPTDAAPATWFAIAKHLYPGSFPPVR
jgi:D-alanyl-D-alanine carboxypeptidase